VGFRFQNRMRTGNVQRLLLLQVGRCWNHGLPAVFWLQECCCERKSTTSSCFWRRYRVPTPGGPIQQRTKYPGTPTLIFDLPFVRDNVSFLCCFIAGCMTCTQFYRGHCAIEFCKAAQSEHPEVRLTSLPVTGKARTIGCRIFPIH
jgi:hypothetical protein